MSKSELFRLKIQRGESVIQKYCTVRNMNYDGEIIHGKFNGVRYILEDGDEYSPETITNYEVEFSDYDPCHNA